MSTNRTSPHTRDLAGGLAFPTLATLLTLLTLPPLLLPRVVEARQRVERKLVGLLNLNEATVEQLGLLPGIGPARAQAIARYREKHRFGWVGQLRRIKGMGPKTFLRIRPYLRVDGATTLARTPEAAAPVPAAPPPALVEPPGRATAGVPGRCPAGEAATDGDAEQSGPASSSFTGSSSCEEQPLLSLGFSHRPVEEEPAGAVPAASGGPGLPGDARGRHVLAESLADGAPLDRVTGPLSSDEGPSPARYSAMPSSLGPVLRLPFPMP